MKDKSYVVVKQQEEICLYATDDGDIAIVSIDDGEDQCIRVCREHVQQLIAGLQRALQGEGA